MFSDIWPGTALYHNHKNYHLRGINIVSTPFHSRSIFAMQPIPITVFFCNRPADQIHDHGRSVEMQRLEFVLAAVFQRTLSSSFRVTLSVPTRSMAAAVGFIGCTMLWLKRLSDNVYR